MGVSRVWYGQPQPLDRDGVWVARALYAEDEDRHLTPIGLEVRPAGLASDDWSPLPSEIDQSLLPESGFPVSLLRSAFRWEERSKKLDQVVNLNLGDVSLGELYELGSQALLQHLQTVATRAVELGHIRPGRRDLARSLFTLIEASAQRSQDREPRSREEIVRAVRELYPDFDETELRATVQWARTHEPPLFLPYGQRQRGGRLTKFVERILILADPDESLDPFFVDQLRQERARELPEFEQP